MQDSEAFHQAWASIMVLESSGWRGRGGNGANLQGVRGPGVIGEGGRRLRLEGDVDNNYQVS